MCVCVCARVSLRVCEQEQSGNDMVNWKHRLCDARFVESAGANVQGEGFFD